MTAAEVRQFSGRALCAGTSPAGGSLDSLPDDYDLVERGIIDSIGILEISGAVEAELEIELDLEHLDAESLTKISPFCRHVEGSAHALVKDSA
jgi:acyl carrier protein